MSLQIISSAGGTASFDGIFIPATDLAPGGIGAVSEFDDAVATELKEAKALYAMLLMLTTEINSLNTLDRLGVTATPPNINNQAHAFTLVTQRYVKDNVDAKPLPVPVASTGANTGRGDFAFTDIFANAAKVASAATVNDAGVLIEYAPLVTYGADSYASVSLNADSRLLIHSFMKWVTLDTTEVPSRSATVASAITARNGGTSTEIAIPATYVAGTDPVSGLTPAEVPITHLLSSGNITISIDTIKSISPTGDQTWEVNVVTA